MFPSMSSLCKYGSITNSGPSTNMAAVGHLWFFLLALSHLLRNYLTNSNETCPLCSPQSHVVQVQKKFRSVDKFGCLVPGSDLVKFPIDRLVIVSPPRGCFFFFLSKSECSPQCSCASFVLAIKIDIKANILISIMGNFTSIHDVRVAWFSNQNSAKCEF